MLLGIPKRSLTIAVALVGIALVYILGGGQQQGADESGGESPAGPGCQFTVTADVLNVRKSPTTDSSVVRKLLQDVTVNAEPTVRNGFRKLADPGWVAEEFLAPVEAASCS
ncbi:MAG: SH3 domain-containing protein [Actinophytocola sp.]|nr:SH3 domain-containing protein [Actinophytocola sp.]